MTRYIIGALVLIAAIATAFGSKQIIKIKHLIIEQQGQTIQTQNEIIKDSKEVFERKIVNKFFSSDTNFEWLRGNICTDCENR